MAKGLGSTSLGGGFGLQSMSRGLTPKAKGLYPNKTSGLGEYGTITFPTVLENYNRTTDYKRWQLGQAYFFGTGRSWDDKALYSNTRFSTAEYLKTSSRCFLVNQVQRELGTWAPELVAALSCLNL